MILYHGSNLEIGRIDLSRSKVGKDFGCGFYLKGQTMQYFFGTEKAIRYLTKVKTL